MALKKKSPVPPESGPKNTGGRKNFNKAGAGTIFDPATGRRTYLSPENTEKMRRHAAKLQGNKVGANSSRSDAVKKGWVKRRAGK